MNEIVKVDEKQGGRVSAEGQTWEESQAVIQRLNDAAEMLGIEERYTIPGMFVQLQQFVPIIEAIARRLKQ